MGLSDAVIAYCVLGVFLVGSSIILIILFFQNGGFENCECTTPKTTQQVSDADEEAGDASDRPKTSSREAWGEAGDDTARSPNIRRGKDLPPELEDADRGEPLSYDPHFKGPRPADDRVQGDLAFCGGFVLCFLLM